MIDVYLIVAVAVFIFTAFASSKSGNRSALSIFLIAIFAALWPFVSFAVVCLFLWGLFIPKKQPPRRREGETVE